jgi:hypothetical protein
MAAIVELVLDDNVPGGVVRVRDGNWKGEALVCSRRKIQSALSGDLLDVSGVYILVGTRPNEKQVEDVIYIGSGDSTRSNTES